MSGFSPLGGDALGGGGENAISPIVLGAITLSGAGTIPAVGALTKTLGSIASTAVGAVPITGALSVQLDDIFQNDHVIFNKTVFEMATATDGLSVVDVMTVLETGTGSDPVMAASVVTDSLDESGTIVTDTLGLDRRMLSAVTEAATLSEATALTVSALLADYAEMASSMSIGAKYKSALNEAVVAADRLQAGIPITLSEHATLAWALTVVQGVTIAEKLGVSEVLSYPIRFKMSLAERVRAYDALANFFNLEISERVTVSEAMSGLSRHFAAISELGALIESLTPRLIIKIEAHDDGVFDDAFTLKSIYKNEIHEQIVFSIAVAMPDGGITTWAVNTRTGAVTEYMDYAFNSFAQMGAHYLGASSSGLYALDGDDDAGSSIISHLRSGYAQFGGSRFTSFKAAYLGIRGDGDIFLKLDTGDGKTYTYRTVIQNQETTKVRLGKGLRARYFAFELITTGQDFDLDTVEFIPLVAQRRV